MRETLRARGTREDSDEVDSVVKLSEEAPGRIRRVRGRLGSRQEDAIVIASIDKSRRLGYIVINRAGAERIRPVFAGVRTVNT
jgi:hypothetical protein